MNLIDRLKKQRYDTYIAQYPNISLMARQILHGPLATQTVDPATNEHEQTTIYYEYEDEILKIYSYGYGDHITIKLKSSGETFFADEARHCEHWYDHLGKIHKKSTKQMQETKNMNNVIKICEFVNSGYSDDVIRVEYEKKTSRVWDSTEMEYTITAPSYACKIFLIPLKQYVFIEDHIHTGQDNWGDVRRYGKWVDHVCSLINDLENSRRDNRESGAKRKRKGTNILKNHTPIDDSSIF